MKKLYNQMFEPIKNVCRKAAGGKVIMMAAILLSSYQGWGQASVVSLAGPTCTTGTLTLTSSIQPARIVWQLGGVTQSTVNATWNPSGITVAGGNGAGTATNQLNGPNSVYRDAAGNLFIAEYLNHRVIEFPSGSTSATNGTVVAGVTGVSGNDATHLNGPSGVWGDAAGNIYVSDEQNNRIQKFPSGSTSGTAATTVTITGLTLSSPEGLMLDAAGTNLYVADQGNNRIVRINLGTNAGTVAAGGNGSGSATNQLNSPTGLYINSGFLYVADFGNNRVQFFGAAGTSSSTTTATTVAGGNGSGVAANQLNNPTNVYVDGLGNVYVADAYNNRIQQWAPPYTTGTTVAGSAAGTAGSSATLLNLPYTITLDASGNIYTAGYNNSRVQEFTSTIPLTYNATTAGNWSAVVTTFKGLTSTANFTVNVPPTLTGSPTSQTICAGGSTSFTGSGTGSGLTYQWQVSTDNGVTFNSVTNGGVYSNATTATLNITGATFSMNGYQYKLVISGTCPPPVTTTAATLTVNANAAVVTNPSPQTICATGNATTGNASFTAAGSGSGTISYQWMVSTNGGTTYIAVTNGGGYSGATSSTLNITGATTAMNGYLYEAVISTSLCPATATTTPALLTVNPLATITGQPAPVTVCNSGNAVFSVTSTGGSTYQWMVSTDNGVTFNNVTNIVPTTGATTPTLSLSGVTTAMNGYQYRLTVTTGSGCAINSNTALLTVYATPAITSQPGSQSVCPGATATFSTTATGQGPLTYQWQLSTDGGTTFAAITGATASTYTTPATTAGMNGYIYNVVVSGFCNSPATSNNATLNVYTLPAITTQPVSATICNGAQATFTVTATGSNLTYQWYKSIDGGVTFNAIAGATTNTHITPVGALAGQYYVVVSGSCAPSVTSNTVIFTVNQPPAVTGGGVRNSVCANNNTTFTVTGSGTGINYQWQVSTNGGASYTSLGAGTAPYSNAQTNALTITGVTTSMNGYLYQAVVSSPLCSPAVTSVADTLRVTVSPTVIFGTPVPACSGPTASTTTIPFSGLTGGIPTFAPATANFAYTGGVQTFTIPTAVTSITVDAAGAQGGAAATGPVVNSMGGRVQATLNGLTPGNTINIYVGGAGSNGNGTGTPVPIGFNGGTQGGGYFGGGGGGASDIRIGGAALANRYIVAGGAGGSGLLTASTPGGVGGNLIAGNGGTAGDPLATAATGGTQAAGGTGTVYTGGSTGSNGALGAGGNPGTGMSGGGGGGYYGGGGGAGPLVGGGTGGGGGSSYTDPSVTGVTLTAGYNTGNGYVNFSYTAQIPAVYTYSIVWSSGPLANVTNQTFPTTGPLNVTIPANAAAGTYTGTLTLNNGSCTTQYPISITVTGLQPVITSGSLPATATVCANTNQTFTVTTTGTVASYQWQVSTNGGTTYTPLTNTAPYSGVGTNQLTVTANTSLNGYRYNVIVTGTCGTPVTSAASILNVTTAPSATFSAIPGVCAGATSATLAYTGLTGGIPTYTPATANFAYTGGAQTFTIPTAVTSITVDAAGAQGGAAASGPTVNSKGGRVQATLNGLTPGNTINIYVGGSGSNGNGTGTPVPIGFNGGTQGGGYFGGGGGGASDIRIGGAALANRYIVAGGAGGSGLLTASTPGGVGGNLVAGNGGTAGDPLATAATGGTQAAGGTGTVYTGGSTGSNGALGAGGNPGTGMSGGGGGGYYGGGGGAGPLVGGGTGGGGGSSYTDPSVTGVTLTSGYNTGNGYVNLSYQAQVPPVYTYSIVWSSGPFVNVTNQTFPTTGPLNIAVPATATPNTTYTGTLTLNNGTCTTQYPISITVNGAPAVTVPPATNVCVTGNTTIPATATGGNLTYQWAFSTNNGSTYTTITAPTATYSTVTTNTLTITGATAAMNGYLYRVSVGNTGGCTPSPAISNPDTLHVLANPSITTQPQSPILGCVGQNATVTVGASGGGLTYQWQSNTGSGFTSLGSANGAQTATLTIPSVTAAMAGTQYNVIVSGACGTPVTSNTATLQVSPIPVSPNAQAAALDSVCGNNLLQIALSGAQTGGYYVVTGPNNFYGTTNGSTIFVSGAATPAASGNYFVYDSVAGCRSTPAINPVSVSTPPVITVVTPITVCFGQPIQFTSSVSSLYPITSISWQTPPNSDTLNNSTIANPSIASAQFVDAGTYYITEKYNYGTLNSGANACQVGPVPVNVNVNPLPATPTVTPSGGVISVCQQSPINLLASSTTGGVSFHWQGPNGAADSQNVATYTQASAAPANQGHYSVVAISSSTGCRSLADTLFLLVKPIPGNPTAGSNSPICAGATLNLTSTASGADSFSWSGPGTPAFAAQTQNPSIISTPLADSGTYTVRAYEQGCASLLTASTYVKINVIPKDPVASLAVNPICQGDSLKFSAFDSTAGTTFLWSAVNPNNDGGPGTSFPSNGGTANIFNIPNARLADSGVYSVVNIIPATGCKSANPSTIHAVVNPRPNAPTITSNQPVCVGQSLHLTAHDSTAALSYNWSGPGITGSNYQTIHVSTLNIAGTTLAFNGLDSVYAIYNGCSSVLPGTLYDTVHPVPANPTATSNSPVCSGNTLRLFSDSVTSVGPLTFVWSGPGLSSTQRNPRINGATVANSGLDSVYTVDTFGCKSILPGVVNVIVNPGPPAPITNNVILCQYAPASPLTAIGTNLKWYRTNNPTDTNGSLIAPIPNDSTPGVYNYYVSESYGTGCESPRAVIVVTVNQKPTPPAVTSTVTYCQYDGAMVLSATGQNDLWYTAATGGIGSPLAPVPSTAVPANYVYYVTQTVAGCESNRQPVTVIVKQIPQPPIVQDITYCENDAAAPLTAVGQNVRWYNVGYGGVGTPIAPIPNTTYPDTMIYYVTQTVNGCESDRVPQHVYVFYKPNVVIKTPAAFVCQHDTMTFFYFGNALPSASFDWGLPAGATVVSSESPDRIVVRFDSAGNQNITLTVNNGNCASVAASLIVQVRPQPTATISSLHDVCQNDIVIVGLTSQTTGTQSYSYNFDGGTIVSNTSPGGPYNIRWTTPGIHVVTLTTTLAVCKSTPATDTVDVHPTPFAHIVSLNAANLANICSGDSVELTAGLINPGYQYQWSPTQFFMHGNNAPEEYANITFSGPIYLKVISDFGCVGNDTVDVNVQPCCALYMPNAFTPNGDGKNDIFHILTIGHHDIRNFRIANRWGQVVFETTNELQGWDGKYNGVPQDMDTYFWYVDYICQPSGKEMKEQGEVYLVR